MYVNSYFYETNFAYKDPLIIFSGPSSSSNLDLFGAITSNY